VTKTYLVELYMPATGPERLAAVVEQARLAAEQSTREGTPVKYVRSIFIPEDETCFHVFEASSAQAMGKASRRAALDHERIVEAVGEACTARFDDAPRIVP
jgi:hypothetical protein